MWRREVHQHNFFFIGLVVGLAIGGIGILGLFLGSELGRNTRVRLGETVQRVRSRINGSTEPQAPPVDAKPSDSEES